MSALLTATLINNRWHCVANDQSLWKSLCRERGWEWKYERREVSQPQRSSSPRKDREVDEGVGEDEDEGNGAGFDAGLAPTNCKPPESLLSKPDVLQLTLSGVSFRL